MTNILCDYDLTKEAESLAKEIWRECEGDADTAQELAHSYADGHEIAIYYGKAIHVCSVVDTDTGESFLEDCGGIAQPGDTFGNIACRIAFAELYCRIQSALYDIEKEQTDGVTLAHNPDKPWFPNEMES